MRRSGLVLLLLAAAGCSQATPPAASTDADDGATASLPDNLTFVADATAAAQTTVTLADGGSVSATAPDGSTFELVVPPMAVAEDTEIRMTPLTDVEGV